MFVTNHGSFPNKDADNTGWNYFKKERLAITRREKCLFIKIHTDISKRIFYHVFFSCDNLIHFYQLIIYSYMCLKKSVIKSY